MERENVFRAWVKPQLWCDDTHKKRFRFFEDESYLCDPAGRFIILNATVQGVKYVFANIYAPNKVRDQCTYFKELQDRLDGIISSPEQKVVIGGDFNVTFDSYLDCTFWWVANPKRGG